MSNQIDKLTDVTSQIEALGQRAESIAEGLKQNLSDATQALDMTDEVSNKLKEASAKLRGVLGFQSNHPPKDA